MTTHSGKIRRPSFVLLAIALPALFFIFRVTAAAAFLGFVLLYILFPLHRSRRSINVAFAFFLLAILVPVDVYVRGFHGPHFASKHSGLRLVHVVHGMPRIERCLDRYGEFIAAGCIVGLHDTRWQLVWD
jgi:hypothetical protein